MVAYVLRILTRWDSQSGNMRSRIVSNRLRYHGIFFFYLDSSLFWFISISSIFIKLSSIEISISLLTIRVSTILQWFSLKNYLQGSSLKTNYYLSRRKNFQCWLPTVKQICSVKRNTQWGHTKLKCSQSQSKSLGIKNWREGIRKEREREPF